MTNDEIDDLVTALIQKQVADKKESGKFPTHATLGNLVGELKESLNRLHAKKKIKVGHTINDRHITVI